MPTCKQPSDHDRFRYSVELFSGSEHQILGYLALPRLMIPDRCVRLSGASDTQIEMHGYNGLDLIRDLVR